MFAVKTKKELQPFCYEHLSEMMPDGYDLPKTKTGTAYVCSQLNCLINYNTSSGYHQHAGEQSTTPSIRCPGDGTPMYLAEINPEHQSYRLWKCPQCGKSLTNLDSMQARA